MSQAHPSSGDCFTDEQTEKHRHHGDKLQRANYLVGELLIALRNSSRETRQFRLVRAEIETTTWWMNFFVEQCEQMIAQGAEQKPDLIRLRGRTVCIDCKEKVRFAADHDASVKPNRAAMENSVWEAQLMALLAFSNRVAGDLFDRACGSCDGKQFPSFLMQLRNALLRQKRYLARVGAQETEFILESLSGKCAECGRSISIAQPNETRLGSSPG